MQVDHSEASSHTLNVTTKDGYLWKIAMTFTTIAFLACVWNSSYGNSCTQIAVRKGHNKLLLQSRICVYLIYSLEEYRQKFM